MPLEITTTGSNAVAGISAERVRATITIEEVEASASHVKAATTFTYEATSATEIWTDPDSNNRIESDTYTLSDVTAILYTKPLDDGYSVIDLISLEITKTPAAETISVSDVFSKVVSYNSQFTDAFTLDDISQVDKYITGNKANIVGFSDSETKGFTKGISDSFGFSDDVATTTTFYRTYTDSIDVDDLGACPEITPVTINSSTLNAAPMGGGARGCEDVSVGLVHGPSDSTGVTDAFSYGATLAVTDGAGVTDTNSWSYVKNITDGFALNDSAALDKTVRGNKSDSIGFGDVASIYISSQKVLNGAAINTSTLG